MYLHQCLSKLYIVSHHFLKLANSYSGIFSLICFITLIITPQYNAFDIATCNIPLGMESGEITDAQITASSSHDTGFVGPHHARFKTDNNGGAWCPKHMVSKALNEYLEVDLLRTHVITAIQTQGRFGKGLGQEYTEAYVVEYWRPGFEKWHRWKGSQGKEILPGNTNTYSQMENILQPIIFASKIRIYPYGQYDRTACLRAEFVGCAWKEGIVSYSIPKGVQRGMEVDLSDKTFDGYEEGDRYIGGLGQLVDGQRGKDNFRTDIHGFGKGFEWVGWRNDTPGFLGKPVEIVFAFDTVRSFNSIILHTNNMFEKDVQVFVHAKVFFSIGGLYFMGEPVQFSYMPDTIMDHARDVTIKLHSRVGKFVKVNLYFAVKWIMLSEVSFVSEPLYGNFSDEVELKQTTFDQNGRENPTQGNDNFGIKKTKSTSSKGTNPVNDIEKKYNTGSQVIAPKPIDQEPNEQNLIGVVILVLTAIIILLVAVILFIVSRSRRARGSNVLDAFQYSFNPNTLGVNVDKHRTNGGAKANGDDNDSIGKNSLYHEPFNVNMYTSGVSGYSAVNNMQSNMTPDYTDVPEGGYAIPHTHMQDYMSTKMCNGGYMNSRRTPPPPLSSIFPRPPSIPPPPMEKYYATTAILKPLKNSDGGGAGSNTMSSTSSGSAKLSCHNYSSDCGGGGRSSSHSQHSKKHNSMAAIGSSASGERNQHDSSMGTMNSQSTTPMINMHYNSNETLQFQRSRTYNFRNYPDNL